MGCRLNSRICIVRRIQLLLELSELTVSEKIFARARTGIGRELAITKRRLSNTTNFRLWLPLVVVDGSRPLIFFTEIFSTPTPHDTVH